jgi:hypothetical protein
VANLGRSERARERVLEERRSRERHQGLGLGGS